MRLGERDTDKSRKKATPDMYPQEGPVDIEDAYEELSRTAFLIWIRLAVATPKDLSGGRRHLAGVLGYSERRCNEVLMELERSGYIAMLSNGPWRKTTIAFMRKPRLKRGHNFSFFV